MDYFVLPFNRCPNCKSESINYNNLEIWCEECGHVELIDKIPLHPYSKISHFTSKPLLNELNFISNYLDLPNFLREDIFYIVPRLKLPQPTNYSYLAGSVMIYIFRKFGIFQKIPRLEKEIKNFCRIKNPERIISEIDDLNDFHWKLSKKFLNIFCRRYEIRKRKRDLLENSI